MDTRITEKEIELEGRKFVLRKFDPMFGSYISLKIFQSSGDEGKGKFNIEATLTKIMGDNYESYAQLQNRILGYCSEVLPAGKIPVINNEGNIAIIGLTAPMMLALSVSVILFSLEDFFDKEEQEALKNQAQEALVPQPQ